MKEKNSNDSSKSFCRKKKYIYIIVISFIVLIIITAVILIGHFKFNWFKKKVDDEADEEIYDLDVKIKNTVNQVDYFTETKKIKSKIVYTSGESDEQEQILYNHFAVFLTDKTVNINSKNNLTNATINMNNCTIVILDSKVKLGENETKLNSFDIFDEKQIKEFESNPHGAIYPMAKFSYFENGTVIDINLPEDMDQYNAQSLIELINNVIPKLSRNKKDDKKKGLSVSSIKTKNGNTLTEIQAPKEYEDKFTGEEYKGSRFQKKTEVDVENEKIKKVSTNTNLVLETQKEDEQEILDFGLQNFTYDISSEIKSTKNEENKQDFVQLIKKLSESIKFIKSDELIALLLLKEQEKDNELEETFEENEDFKKIVKKDNEESEENEAGEENIEESDKELINSKQVRKLRWEGSFSRSWTIASSNILGKTVSLQYEIDLSGGELSNTLSVNCGIVTLYFGNIGTTKNKNPPKKNTGDKQLFKIPFPGTPIPVTFSFKVGGTIGYNVNFDIYTSKFSTSLTGELYAKAELGAGVSGIAEIDVGARGTLISLTAEGTLTKKGNYYEPSESIYASGGKINCYVIGKLLNHEVFSISNDFLKGWSKILH